MSRWLCMQQVEKNFRMSSAWIPTAKNTLADSLSRYGDPKQQDLFRNYAESLSDAPTRCHVADHHFNFHLNNL